MPKSHHRFPRLGVLALAAFLVLPAAVSGQELSPVEIEILRQNPALLSQRLQSLGLSPTQIRQQLVAAGLPPTALDAFIEGGQPTAQSLTADALAAINTLGIGDFTADGAEPVPTSVGLQGPFETNADSTPAPAPEAVRTDSGLFGLDVFRRTSALFQPTLTGPVPATYRLGPGDQLILVLTGDVELVHELAVTREGFVVIPQVGQVMVNNLTFSAFRAMLRDRLARSYSGINAGTTSFDVTITRLRTIQVFVTGEVVQPSAYQLASVATMLNAIYAAGGPTRSANFRHVQLRRGGELASELDLYDYLLAGDTGDDMVLQDGDVVFVPLHGTRATIGGAVRRPAVYELRDDETLTDLVASAGGFAPNASLRRISIRRIVPPADRGPTGPSRVVIDVPVDQVADGLAPAVPIESGDMVTVSAIVEAEAGYVTLDGAVYEPGVYGWRPGMPLSELVDLAGGPQPAAHAGRVHVSRLNPTDSTRFLLSTRMPEPGQPWRDDMRLQEFDIVTIYDRTEFRNTRMVRIGGMVNQPGEYEYNEGMTLRDLILMARGLRDGAYLDTAEVARLPESRATGNLSQLFRVPMDSTYLVEPETSTYRRLPGTSTAPGAGMPDFELRPFDQVSILRQPDWELLRRVAISGEVAFPGPYALTNKAERISQLVQRAGGLLGTSFPEGARLIRQLDSAGPVNIELSRALNQPGGRYDLVLQPGDSLHVPEYIPTVRVEGAVLAPVSVVYRPGASLGYYVENAGGYSREADRKRVSIEYANGSRATRGAKFLFFGGGYPDPGPGSVVTVPFKDPADALDTRGLIADIVAIMGSLTTVIIVATR